MKGYILVHRKLWDHWIWLSPLQSMRWLDIIYLALWEDKSFEFANKTLDLKRGQFVTTIRVLMARWRTNGDTVRRFLNLLERHNMIKCKKYTDMTVITVTNYNVYQREKLLQSLEDETEEQIVGVSIGSPEVQKDNGVQGAWTRTRTQIELNNKETNTLSQKEQEEKFLEEIKASQSFIESVAKNHSLDVAQVQQWLEKFCRYIISTEHWHNNCSDAKDHFFNWLDKKLTNIQNGKEQRKPSGTTEQDRFAARRGTDVGDKKESDYGGSF